MVKLAVATIQAFDRRLERVGVAADEQPGYRRWVHFYLDFCAKYGHEAIR